MSFRQPSLWFARVGLASLAFLTVYSLRTMESSPEDIAKTVINLPPQSITVIPIAVRNPFTWEISLEDLFTSCGCSILAGSREVITPGETMEVPLQVSSKFLDKGKPVAIYWAGGIANKLVREIYLEIDGEPIARSTGFEGGGEFFPGTILETSILFSDGFNPVINEARMTPTKGSESVILDFRLVEPGEYSVAVVVDSLSGALSGEVEIQVPVDGEQYSALVQIPYSFSSGWFFSVPENLANQPFVELAFSGSELILPQFSPGESSWGAPAICFIADTYSWSMASFDTEATSNNPAVSVFHNGEQFLYPLPVAVHQAPSSSSARFSFEFH